MCCFLLSMVSILWASISRRQRSKKPAGEPLAGGSRNVSAHLLSAGSQRNLTTRSAIEAARLRSERRASSICHDRTMASLSCTTIRKSSQAKAHERTADDLFASFLCALPPALRPQWAETYTRLSSPTSLLITLQSPLDGDRRGGPPYSVGSRDKPNEVYEQLLGSDWEMCYSRAIRAEEHRKIGIDAGAQGDEGRERIAIWKRKQTTSKI